VSSKDRPPKISIIRGADGPVQAWRPPNMRDVRDPRRADDEAAPLLTAGQLEQLQKQAHAEGFEQGRSEGLEYGHREALEEGRRHIAQRLGDFDRLLSALDRPFQQLDDQVENEVVTLVIAMVRQLVRREIRMDPGHVVGVVREALGVLPVASRSVRVLLNPEDAELVREIYSLGDSEQKWQIVEDPVIQRGGCKVVTETSQVDATLESRINALIAPLLAGERSHDGSDQD